MATASRMRIHSLWLASSVFTISWYICNAIFYPC